MNVKEALLNNVRGRVRDLLWKEIDKETDIAEQEASAKGVPYDDRAKIETLYKKTQEWYAKYEPFLKEMEDYAEKAAD